MKNNYCNDTASAIPDYDRAQVYEDQAMERVGSTPGFFAGLESSDSGSGYGDGDGYSYGDGSGDGSGYGYDDGYGCGRITLEGKIL